MSGTGSDIAISITVVDKNGVATVQQLESAVASMGTRAAASGEAAAAGMGKMNEGILSSREQVRLLNDDLGIRIPRAMQQVIAHSQLLSSVIGGIGTGLITLGAVEIFAQIGKSIYDAYEKYIDLDAIAKQYNDTVAKAKDQDFIHPHSIETAILRLDQATDSAEKLHAAASGMRGDFWSEVMGGFASGGIGAAFTAGAGNLMGSHQMEQSSVKSREQADALQDQYAAMQQKLALGRIELVHAGDSDLKGQAAITAEMKKQIDLVNQEAEGTRNMDHAKGNPTAQALIGQAQHQEIERAEIEAQAKRADLARQETQEEQRMRAESLAAGLEGNALYAAQETAQIAAITAKFHDSEISKQAYLSETASTHSKFAAEAMKRQEDLDAQTRKMEADAAAAGLTGIARIQAENQAALAAIDEAERKATGGAPETDAQRQDFSRQRAATGTEGAQKQAEAERQYYEQMAQMMDGFTAQSQEGYARIQSDADKSAQSVWKSWSATWGQLDAMDAGWVESVNKAAQMVGQIYSNADTEAARLHQQTMDSLRKEEEEAARASLPPWQAAELAIVDTYNDRVQRDKEALAQQKINWQEYNADIVAAGAAEQAQLQKQAEETRDKMASSLQSFFKNPAQFLENRAMDSAFQFMANGLTQFMQGHPNSVAGGGLGWLFGMNGEASTSTNPSTFGRSLLGMGGQHSGIGGFDALTSGATTLQTGATTLSTASTVLLQAANALSVSGGGGAGAGGGIASDLGLPGFGGISAGSTSSALGGSAASAGGASGGGVSGISDADIAQLSGSTGPNAGGGFSSIGGGLSQNASTATGAAGKWMGAGGAAITGAMGLYSAYENSSPLAGAVSGAMSGAAIGSAFAPGIGTGIGAAVGAVAGILAGIFGDKGKSEAQDLDWKTVQPGIASELQAYNSGQSGYTQIAQYLDNLQITAQQQTNSWGSGARSWYAGHIVPEIQAAQIQLNQEEKGGRSLVGMSAAQYHVGGMINDFGDLALNSSEGFILAQRGEMMMTAGAASTYGPTLHGMNSGAISAGALRGNQMVPASSAGGAAPISITAWDAASVQRWLANGGATQLRQGANVATTQYGGKGVR